MFLFEFSVVLSDENLWVFELEWSLRGQISFIPSVLQPDDIASFNEFLRVEFVFIIVENYKLELASLLMRQMSLEPLRILLEPANWVLIIRGFEQRLVELRIDE